MLGLLVSEVEAKSGRDDPWAANHVVAQVEAMTSKGGASIRGAKRMGFTVQVYCHLLSCDPARLRHHQGLGGSRITLWCS